LKPWRDGEVIKHFNTMLVVEFQQRGNCNFQVITGVVKVVPDAKNVVRSPGHVAMPGEITAESSRDWIRIPIRYGRLAFPTNYLRFSRETDIRLTFQLFTNFTVAVHITTLKQNFSKAFSKTFSNHPPLTRVQRHFRSLAIKVNQIINAKRPPPAYTNPYISR